jgi:hypothetical protein
MDNDTGGVDNTSYARAQVVGNLRGEKTLRTLEE